MDIQQATLNTDNGSGSAGLRRQYVNWLPNVLFHPLLSNNRYVQFQYYSRVVAPSVLQLQPVADVTNPLFIQVGNPDLRPEYSHLFSTTYNHFDALTYKTLFATLSAGVTAHRIVTATTIDASGVQTIRPVNSPAYVAVSGNVALGRPVPIRTLKGNLNATTTLNLSRSVSYVNNQPNRSLLLNVGQGLGANVTVSERLEVGVSGQVTYQAATYSLQAGQQANAITTVLTGQGSFALPGHLMLVTSASYTGSSGRSAGYNQRFVLWNAHLSRSLLLKQGELRLSAFDLLNQNRSLLRMVAGTYIEDGQSLTLRRYLLLSLVYNLRQFGTGQS